MFIDRSRRLVAIILCALLLFSLLSCGNDDEDVILPAHTHQHISTYVKGNCITYGYTNHVCFCGDSQIVYDTEYGTHVYGEFEVDEPATYSSTGIRSRHCKYCDERTDITTIPKLQMDIPPTNI